MHIKSAFTLLLLAAPFMASAEGDSPWLPIPGQFALTLSHQQQSGKDAYIGGNKLSIATITGGAATKYSTSATNVRLDYGWSDSLAFDLTLGYGSVKAGAADQSHGMLDTLLGVSWRVLDEFEQPALPTVTLRLGAILKGDYDGARLAGLGNDANGFELAAIVGKQITSAWSVTGELGVQNRDSSVPNATFVEVGTRYRFAPGWSANIGYSMKRYGGDLDIGGPGFSPARFQQVREERELVKVGLGYALAGNQGVALSLSKLTAGRNTVANDSAINVAYTYAF